MLASDSRNPSLFFLSLIFFAQKLFRFHHSADTNIDALLHARLAEDGLKA
jgi:hypothetical protein